MRLGVFMNTAKDIGHLGLGVREIIHINFKLILQLKLPIVKGRISSIYK